MVYKSRIKRKDFLNKGISSFSTLFLVVLGLAFGAAMTGNTIPSRTAGPNTTALGGNEIVFPSTKDSKDNLQLKTFTIKDCGKTAALNFLIDNSGSMAFGSKMPNLKSGLGVFAENFPNNGAVALQTYSVKPVERLPFDKLFGESKPRFLQAVTSMRPLSATHSRDAFIFAKQKLDAGRPKFPNHTFAMVFISDGIPETLQSNIACTGGMNGPTCGRNPSSGKCRCFANEQDPTDIAAQVKNSGVRVFTIAYTETEDQKFDSLLKNMMTRVATSPEDAYVAPNDNKIADIVKQITTKICKE